MRCRICRARSNITPDWIDDRARRRIPDPGTGLERDGKQILVEDPAGNVVELFQPA
jgi:hypothetical protein